ncbi:replication factor C small subunit [Candidatus Woesearchaeota archaeon]|nr:replication factor C small subunit [Candidatus Woesearchaeota archaeon]
MNEYDIWIEKYRPKTFDEIIGQEAIVRKVKAFVESKRLPHLIFSGAPGTGKSSIALVIARSLYGESWRDNFLELNGSDARGIDTIRGEVKSFARTRSVGNFPYRIIFLDESDALTSEAQQALRRTMENFSNSCRFIFSANYSSKIIEPIQSRCVVFRFKPLSNDALKKVIKIVCDKEGLRLNDKVLEIILKVADGDVRTATNILQSAASLSKTISEENIFEATSYANPKEIEEILNSAVNGNFLKARELLLNLMIKQGIDGLEIVKQFQKNILDLNLDEKKKLSMIEKCGETEFRLVEGSDPFIQLQSLIASFSKLNEV